MAIYLSARDKNFVAQMFSLSYLQTNPDGRKISKNLKLGLFGPYTALIFFLSVPWTGNELAGDDVRKL